MSGHRNLEWAAAATALLIFCAAPAWAEDAAAPVVDVAPADADSTGQADDGAKRAPVEADTGEQQRVYPSPFKELVGDPTCGGLNGGRLDIPATAIAGVIAAIARSQDDAQASLAGGPQSELRKTCQLLPCLPGCGGDAQSCTPETFELLGSFVREGGIPWDKLTREPEATIALMPNHCLVGLWEADSMPVECRAGYRMMLRRAGMDSDAIDELMAN